MRANGYAGAASTSARLTEADRCYCDHCGEYSILVEPGTKPDQVVLCRRCRIAEPFGRVQERMARRRLRPRPVTL
jgi:hypothetical protein